MKTRLVIPIVAALAIASPYVQAKDAVKTGAANAPEVVAHIALTPAATVQMFTRQEAKGRLYLYALHASGEAAVVVDVTNAAHPVLVPQGAPSATAGYKSVESLGPNTTLVEIADPAAAPTAAAPAKTLALLDTSNPLAPQVTLRFAGVTAVSRDDNRSLIFIANSEGLWIVRHHEPPDVGVAAWENFVSAR